MQKKTNLSRLSRWALPLLVLSLGCAAAEAPVPATSPAAVAPAAPTSRTATAAVPAKLVWRARFTQPACNDSMITCKSGEKAGGPRPVAGASCLLDCAVTTLVCTPTE